SMQSKNTKYSTLGLFLTTDRTANNHGHFFFFNDTATTEIYTLSLHDPLPISGVTALGRIWVSMISESLAPAQRAAATKGDRKSTRLNSSHPSLSYAVFCF